MIAYEVLLREKAFLHEKYSEAAIAKLASGDHHTRPHVPSKWPAQVSGLIQRCWHENPEARPEFDAVRDEVASWLGEGPLAAQVATTGGSAVLLEAVAQGSRHGLLESLGLRKSV